MKQTYGYVSVSSRDQNIDRQMAAMEVVGIPKKKIYIDRQSGKSFVRPEYQKLVKKLKKGDELYVQSIDRLGRDYDETIEQWRHLTRVTDIDIIVLDFPLLDTRNQVNGITGKFIADLVLQILSYVAQVECENIHQRQMKGIVEAKKKGVQFGRPRQALPKNFHQIAKHWHEGEMSQREAARQLNISHTTFARWVNNREVLKK